MTTEQVINQEAATWLITGCSTGLGRALAEAVLDRGYNLVVTSRKLADVQDIADAYPNTALAAALDVTDQYQIARVLEQIQARFGRIDVLVNNAGFGFRGAVEEASSEEMRRIVETNFFGTVNMIQAVLPGMRTRRTGAIMNLSSIGGRFGPVGSGYYSATKFAVEGLSDALRKEVGPLGIRVMVVEPGAFRTDFGGRSLTTAKHVIDDYEPTVGPRRTEKNDGKQPGDPAKAAQVLIDTYERAAMPFRLLLGSDAVQLIRAELDAQRHELETWANVSETTDFAG